MLRSGQCRRYVGRLMLCSGLLAVLVVAFTLLVNPYGIWNLYDRVGFNYYHAHKESFERVNKAIDVMRLQPTVLLAGSSRTKFGLEPEYYTELTGNDSVYNIGVNGPNIYVVRRLIENAVLTSPQIKEIVLGVDFMMFNEKNINQPGFDDEQLDKTYITPKNLLLTLFSLDAVKASQESLLLNYRERRHYDVRTANGMGTDEQALYYHKWNGKAFKEFANSARDFINKDDFYRNFRFSADYFANFTAIVELCRAKGIKLVVYVPPIHAIQQEGIAVCQVLGEYEQWKRELAKIVDYYDFSGYNSVTSEVITPKREFFWDSSHYKRSVGYLIMDRIWRGSGDASFGKLVTAANVESHLRDARAERAEWLRNNQQLVEQVNLLQGFVDFRPSMLLNGDSGKMMEPIVFDSIMGEIPRSRLISRQGRFHLSGWVATDQLVLGQVFAVLNDAAGKAVYYAACDIIPRPDITNLLKSPSPSPLSVGFRLDAGLDRVLPGEYTLKIIISTGNGQTVYESDAFAYKLKIE